MFCPVRHKYNGAVTAPETEVPFEIKKSADPVFEFFQVAISFMYSHTVHINSTGIFLKYFHTFHVLVTQTYLLWILMLALPLLLNKNVFLIKII